MKLFDFHCDTACEMYKRGLDFNNSILHINSSRLAAFDEVFQVFAIFAPPALTDEEAYDRFFTVRDYFLSALEKTQLPCKMRPIL